VPEEDESRMPPLKVMRRRLNGVYSAEGFRGSTRRYVLIVAMLVGLASVPTLAAITAETLKDGSHSGAMDVPLMPAPSTGLVMPQPGSASTLPTASRGTGPAPPAPVLPPASSPASGPSSAAPIPSEPVSSGPAGGPVHGQAGKQSTRPSTSDNSEKDPENDSSGRGSASVDGSQGSGSPTATGSHGPSSGGVTSHNPGWGVPSSAGSSSAGSGSGSGLDNSDTDGPDLGGSGSGVSGLGDSGADSSGPESPSSSSESPSSGSGSSGSGSSGSGSSGSGSSGSGSSGTSSSASDGSRPHGSRSHRSQDDDSDGYDSGSSRPQGPHAHGSRNNGSHSSGSDDSGAGDEAHKPDDSDHKVHQPWCNDRDDCSSRPSHHHRPDRSRHCQCDELPHQAGNSQASRAGQRRTAVSFASQPPVARCGPVSNRRSAVTECPQNLRPARTTDRTQNSHRHQFAHAQTDAADLSYRGSHRVEHSRRTEEQRNSRVGHHHTADRHHSGRW
jgi:hypothetical protein